VQACLKPVIGTWSRPVLEIVEGTIIVLDGMRVSQVTESPIKASVGSSKGGEGKGVAGFERFVANDVGVGRFVRTVVGFGGAVDHLSG